MLLAGVYCLKVINALSTTHIRQKMNRTEHFPHKNV